MSPCSLFQFTPLCERLPFTSGNFPSNVAISIHASLREATKFLCVNPISFLISIHASLREATTLLLFFGSQALFQFTPLCERLQASWWRFSTQPLFQFTPLCERLPRITVMRTLFRYFNSRLSARGYSKNRQYIAVFQLNFCLISLLCYIHSIIL